MVRPAHSYNSAETSTVRVRLSERVSDAIEHYLMACLCDRDAVYEGPAELVSILVGTEVSAGTIASR